MNPTSTENLIIFEFADLQMFFWVGINNICIWFWPNPASSGGCS